MSAVDLSATEQARTERTHNILRLEGYAQIITGEYLYSALHFSHETRRTYVFRKYGITITIPKRIMEQRIKEISEETP